MKHILFLAALFIALGSNAQALKRLADRAKQKVENTAGNKVDNAIDKAANGQKNTNSNTNTNTDSNSNTENNSDSNDDAATTKNTTPTLQAYSKYDFIPGENILAFENFERTDIGDFPTNWNTNGSAEVVTLNTVPGKWLKIKDQGHFHAEFIKNMPENSTLEFDLGVTNNYSWGSSSMYMYLTSLQEGGNFANTGYYNHYLQMEFHPLTGENYTGGVTIRTENTQNRLTNNGKIRNWDAKKNLFAHVSLWRQGQRLRLYVNGDKIFDLPKAFDVDGKYTHLFFMTHDLLQDKGDYLLLGNIRLAVGKPDTRNKLITEGKFVTRGILFDVNSDQIKPESYGTLKDIAAVLKDNPTVKVKIVGHTDSDGDDNANLDLSKRRAAAVKAALVKDFGVTDANLETDGKGESQSLNKNSTAEEKANNRRVEFLKL